LAEILSDESNQIKCYLAKGPEANYIVICNHHSEFIARAHLFIR